MENQIFQIGTYAAYFGNSPLVTKEWVENQMKQAFSPVVGFVLQQLHVGGSNIDKSVADKLNQPNCDLAFCAQHFKNNASEMNYNRKIPETGDVWRHFKTGKIVTVIAIANDTENPGFYSVIYKCPDGSVWNRPLDMFMSEVDRDKYPDAKQKYRFERVTRDCHYCKKAACHDKTSEVDCYNDDGYYSFKVEDPIKEAEDCADFDYCDSFPKC